MPICTKTTRYSIQRHYLHFLDKHGIWVGEDDPIDASHRGPRVEEVDPQVSVVALLALADVLWRGGVSGWKGLTKKLLLLVQFGTHCDLNPYPDILRYSTLMYLTLLRTARFIVLIYKK